MAEKEPADRPAYTPEEIAAVLKHCAPADFDGHTDFQRFTASQRLDWLAQAATFVYEFKGAARRPPTSR